MKIFDNNEQWGSKVNFVDENNVFVGYDTNQDCCEDANWFIKDEMIVEGIGNISNTPHCQELENQESYMFDQSFFFQGECGSLDAGGFVVFKLCSYDHDDKYLYLYNAHNGYYGHGFEFKIGEDVIQEGCL